MTRRTRWYLCLHAAAALFLLSAAAPMSLPNSPVRSLVQQLEFLPQGVIAQESAFMGVPLTEYYSRADEVYRHRVTGWFKGRRTSSNCALAGSRCSLGLLCVGPEGAKKCAAPVADGSVCDAHYAVCKETSVCQSGVCWAVVREGGSCASAHTRCADDLFCKAGACVQASKEFKACDAGVPCAKGLVCDMGMCLSADGKRHGERCDVNRVECKRGLACAANTKFGPQPTCIVSADLVNLIPCTTGCPLGFTCQRNVCWYTWDKFAYCALGSFQLCKPGLSCVKSTKNSFWTCK